MCSNVVSWVDGYENSRLRVAMFLQPVQGGGIRTALKNHKNLGFLSNTGPDPLKNYKATKPAFNVGPPSARQRNAI